MINSKLEKLLLILIWYGLVITFRFILPISEPPSDTDRYIVVFLSVLVTVIAHRIYVYLASKHILKKIQFLLVTNHLDESIKYIDKCLLRQKKFRLLYAYRLYVLAMCGQITKFDELYFKCKESNKYEKLVSLDFVQGSLYIINSFKAKTFINNGVCASQQDWIEIINALSAREDEKSEQVLLGAYCSAKLSMIKSVFAFKLYLTYLKLGNTEKAEYYYNCALKYAPSLEVTHYIENARDL